MMDEILMDADGRMCGGMLSPDEARTKKVALGCAKAKIATLEDKLAMEERVSRESLDALALIEERRAYWQNRALAAEERLTRKDAPLHKAIRR
jgi:hypothetical protein